RLSGAVPSGACSHAGVSRLLHHYHRRSGVLDAGILVVVAVAGIAALVWRREMARALVSEAKRQELQKAEVTQLVDEMWR
ncbi:MAG: hypothetical protein ACE1Y9_03220, partial [Acidimicrobiia bacterium]